MKLIYTIILLAILTVVSVETRANDKMTVGLFATMPYSYQLGYISGVVTALNRAEMICTGADTFGDMTQEIIEGINKNLTAIAEKEMGSFVVLLFFATYPCDKAEQLKY